MAFHLISFGHDARTRVLAGIRKLAAAVKITLGPRGRNTLLERQYAGPQIINDGVTIARGIKLPDPYERMGADLVTEVATKTNETAGDGTTTATLLAEAIAVRGMKKLGRGANAVALRAGIVNAAECVVAALQKMKTDVSDDMIAQVATISAQDPAVGKKIAEAVAAIGNGPITVQESQSMTDLELEIKKGMQFDQGYVSAYFDPEPRTESVREKTWVLVVDGKISAIPDFLPFAEKFLQAGRKELVIIAEDVDGEALPTFVVNNRRGVLNVLAIKAPGFGDRRKSNLQDIAVVTGATVVSKDMGLELKTVDLDVLGRAAKVIATKDHTTIVDGQGDPAAIEAHVVALRAAKEDAKNTFEKDQLDQRIAKIAGGVAVIKVGAVTETELREKKLRIEDAINATKAAMEEGIVAGGGFALLTARESIRPKRLRAAWPRRALRWIAENVLAIATLSDEEEGQRIVYEALAQPVWQIAENAGANGKTVLRTCVKLGKGYNAATGEYQNLVKVGVIDPLKVVRMALMNAASVASVLITTECAVVEEPTKNADAE